MRVGNQIFNVDFFKGWTFEDFERFFKLQNYEDSTSKKAKEVFELLGLKVEKKQKIEQD